MHAFSMSFKWVRMLKNRYTPIDLAYKAKLFQLEFRVVQQTKNGLLTRASSCSIKIYSLDTSKLLSNWLALLQLSNW